MASANLSLLAWGFNPRWARNLPVIGIINLPVNNWIKGVMGMAFSVGSTFTLAKTTRDLHEATKIVSRIDEAHVEKLLTQNHPLK